MAIKPDTLAMHLDPTWRIKLAHWARAAFDLAGVFAVLILLVRPHWRRMMFPLVLIAIAAAIIAAFDVTTFGGLRAQEGGNDGLFYDAAARVIVQHLVAGDVASALEGTEPVYYYGGPGLRYLRALEMIVFGDTNLGYLSLLLVYPLVIWRVFRRFLPTDWAFVLLILFVATPIGAYFGSTFFLYVKYALQGFGDPVSYLFYLAGLAIIVGWPRAGPGNRFGPACVGAALLFLATFVRPIVAPAVAVLLGGAGLVALWQRQWSRLAGLCAGFVPVLAMPLHNWYFGDRLVLFSANASGNNLHVRPADYVAALAEMSHLKFAGPHVHAIAIQLIDWPTGFIGQRDLGGLAAYAASAPVHLAAVAILVYVVGWGRRYDPWLRLIAGAALAQHTVAFFYGGAARYFFLTWLLTMLVTAVWCERDGLRLFRGLAPNAAKRIANSRLVEVLGAALAYVEAGLQLRAT